ncbi:MAG TPA: hypothetical protein VE869_07090 [Gemmatimonas sp.]|nr:hypothetical protein [Gemmatimonas sp.]
MRPTTPSGVAQQPASETSSPPERWRPLVLAVLVIGFGGTLAELLLLGHYDDRWQFAPLALGAALLLALLWSALSRGAAAVRAVRYLSLLSCVSAFVGIVLHYRVNVEWELETTPEMHGLELFREAITGALPLLAPGTMLQLGLLGLIWTFRHPRLATPATGGNHSLES